MPTYEYECKACGHRFERFEKISEPGNRECPKCRKTKATRRISGGAGLIFKGSGFYVTDSRKSPPPEAKGGEGGSKKPAEAGKGKKEGRS